MRAVPWWGVFSSAAAPVLLAGGWAVAAGLQPRSIDPVTSTISALAADGAADRWLMTLVLLAVGACDVMTGLALRPAALPGRLILIAGGIAGLLVAANPEPASGGSGPHALWATIGFIALTVWPVGGLRLGRSVPRGLRPAVSFVATGTLLSLLVWFGLELITGGRQVGLAERVLTEAQALWPLAVVLTCRQSARRPGPCYPSSLNAFPVRSRPYAGLEIRFAALSYSRCGVMIVTAGVTSAPYDGTGAFPAASTRAQTAQQRALQLTVTGLIVVLPFAGLIAAMWLLWGRGVGVADVGLAALFYLVTGFGVTVGFHRCLTHRSFTARPVLRVALAVAGSMAFEGDVTGWVATHRRHHAFTDRPGDPHSPYRYGTGPAGQLRGLLHAHAGWLFGSDPTPQQRYAPDMLADPAMRRISKAFPALCAATLALPFAAGWGLGGTWQAAVLALVWAGLVRIFFLQHVTWSVNSLCHLLGSRPFTTRRHDRATNLWPLALLSLGESWHNMHHSDPACARHGVDRGQIDLSAELIRVFERFGWVSGVRWPTPARLSQRRRRAGDSARLLLVPRGAARPTAEQNVGPLAR